MEVTNNNLDLAINGRGFFQIQRPDGETAYTRAGSFQLNPDGDIVTGDGYLVEPNITVPEDAIDISVNENGEVFVKLDGQIEPQNVGQLQLVSFANPAGLEAIGQNLLLETPASGDPTTGNPGDDGFGRIEQGTLELSNVDIVSEITRMITAQRAYEMNSKVIQTSDEMLGEIARMS
jgi:flagellar basal-body rod protein FlgG